MGDRESRRWERQRLKERRLDDRDSHRRYDRERRIELRDRERSKYEARWPYVVSAIFFAVGFVPGLGWITVAGFVFLPLFWAAFIPLTAHRVRPYVLAMLFAAVNAVVALVAQLYYLLHM